VDPAPPSAVDGPPSPGLIALQFEDGTAVPIHGSGYIGRAPSVPDGEPGDAALITVPDGDRSVSRTHGRFGIIGTQTWFEDLGSGNGSSLRTGDGRQGPMTPNQRFTLVPGMVIQLGDCVIRVVAG
jgi:pSer/pThr/pTyr-binding forkhead associated (FHA) protein